MAGAAPHRRLAAASSCADATDEQVFLGSDRKVQSCAAAKQRGGCRCLPPTGCAGMPECAHIYTHTHMHSTFEFPQGCVSYRIYPRRARARVVGVMHHHCCLHGQPVLIKVMTSCSLQQSHLVRGKISKHTRKSPSNKKGLCKLRASNKVAKDTMSRSRPAGAQKPSLTAHVR
jgi:hypothetical protein